MKRGIIFLFVFLFAVLASSTANGDVISVNSGGTNDIVINPDSYIEGFFACFPATCSRLGYNCDSWNNGCGGTINCGSCASGFTCSSGTCVAAPVTPSGPGGGVTPSLIEVAPAEIRMTLAFNPVTNMTQRTTQKIYITNNRGSAQTLSITQSSSLNGIVILPETSATISPGETRELTITLIAPLHEGDIEGQIFIGSETIHVFLEITSNPLWFDANIVVLNRNYKVSQGKELKTKVDVVPMGDKQKIDVTLNYVIKDYDGEIYFTHSETLLVEDKMSLYRNFGTGSIPVGKYIIELELVYPGSRAPSSAHFEVVETTTEDFLGLLMFILITAIIIVSILIVVLSIRAKGRKRKEE